MNGRDEQRSGNLQHIGGLIDLNRYEQARRRAAERAAADPKSARAPARPNCAACGGAGWLKLYGTGEYGSEGNRYTLVLCDCRQDMVAEKRQRRLDRWSTLEDDHTGDTFERAVVYEHQRFAYERAHAYAHDPQGFLVLMGDYGVGKCVAAHEVLTLADGSRVKALDLVGQYFVLLTTKEGRVVPVAARAQFNAIEPTYSIETLSGRRITRNAKHLLWVGRRERTRVLRPTPSTRLHVVDASWTALTDIHPGDAVAVTTSLPAFAPVGRADELSEDEIKVLAYLIGDGGFTGSLVVFTQQNNTQLAEFRAAAESIGCAVIPVPKRTYAWRVVGKSRKNKGTNPAINLLRRFDLFHCHSRDKHVPAAVWRLSESGLRLFLSRLFSTDGWACVSRPAAGRSFERPEIGYCSMSERLVREVQELLIKLGIRSNVYLKAGVNAWNLTIHRADSIVRFAREVGIYGKEDAVARTLACAQEAMRRAADYCWSDVGAPLGTHWETVTSITPQPAEATVAIEVPDGHTYLTSYFEHNSFLAACIAWTAYHSGRGVLWIKSSDLVAHLRDTYRHESETTQSEQLREMGEAPLLCLDDLGAEADAHDVQNHINALIDRRYLKKLPTVIATNKTLDELGGRVASRAAEVGMLALVSGGDKRLHIDEPMEGLTKYHYYARRPILCSVCHGRPCLSNCRGSESESVERR